LGLFFRMVDKKWPRPRPGTLTANNSSRVQFSRISFKMRSFLFLYPSRLVAVVGMRRYSLSRTLISRFCCSSSAWSHNYKKTCKCSYIYILVGTCCIFLLAPLITHHVPIDTNCSNLTITSSGRRNKAISTNITLDIYIHVHQETPTRAHFHVFLYGQGVNRLPKRQKKIVILSDRSCSSSYAHTETSFIHRPAITDTPARAQRSFHAAGDTAETLNLSTFNDGNASVSNNRSKRWSQRRKICKVRNDSTLQERTWKTWI